MPDEIGHGGGPADVLLAEPHHGDPALRERGVPARILLGVAVPVRAVRLDRDAGARQEEVRVPTPHAPLAFVLQADVVEGAAHGGLDRRLAAPLPVACRCAEPARDAGAGSHLFAAARAGEADGRASALLAAMVTALVRRPEAFPASAAIAVKRLGEPAGPAAHREPARMRGQHGECPPAGWAFFRDALAGRVRALLAAIERRRDRAAEGRAAPRAGALRVDHRGRVVAGRSAERPPPGALLLHHVRAASSAFTCEWHASVIYRYSQTIDPR